MCYDCYCYWPVTGNGGNFADLGIPLPVTSTFSNINDNSVFVFFFCEEAMFFKWEGNLVSNVYHIMFLSGESSKRLLHVIVTRFPGLVGGT